MIRNAILGLWYAGIGLRAVLLVLLLWRGLARRYPCFVGYLGIGLVRSGIVAAAFGSRESYTAAWTRSEGVMIAALSLVVLEAWWRLAEHYRVGSFAVVLVTVFGGLSALACWASSGLMGSGCLPVLLAARYHATACIAFLALSLGLFATFRLKIRPNVHSHVRILLVYLAVGAVTTAVLSVRMDYWPRAAARLAAGAGVVLSYGWWCLRMRRGGEAWEAPPPVSDEEWNAGVVALEAKVDLLAGLRRRARAELREDRVFAMGAGGHRVIRQERSETAGSR